MSLLVGIRAFMSFFADSLSTTILEPSLRMPKCRNIDVEDKSISQLQNFLTDKKLLRGN